LPSTETAGKIVVMTRRAVSICAVIGAGLLGTAVEADAGWLATRGDAQRTGTSPTTGSITTPAIRWRYYLGGYADARSFQPVASAVAGKDVVFLASSGRLEARRPDDAVLWRSPINGVDRVLAVRDLDGNGSLEVVGISRYSGRAFVHDASTGELRWSSPAGRYGTVAVADVRDVDGDGLDDLFLVATGSFRLAGPQYGDVWRFASGVTTPSVLWTIDTTQGRDYDRDEFDAWADVDGDGRAELIAFGKTHAYIYDAATGAIIASGDIGSVPAAQAQTIVADVDAAGVDPGEEIVVFTNTSYGAALSTRHAMVLDVADGAVNVRWKHGVADVIEDRHVFGGESVADVDGDGVVDVVSSFYVAASGQWTTHARRGNDGVVIASMSGVFVGATDVDGDGAAEVLTRPDPDANGVVVYDVSAVGATVRWARTDVRWVLESDPGTEQRQSLSARTLTIDVDGDGTREVVVQRMLSGVWQLNAFDLADATPTIKRTYPLPAGVTVLTMQRRGLGTSEYLFVARSDGYMPILNRNFVPVNEFHYPGGIVPGMKLGGYYPGWRGISSTLLAADLFGAAGDDLLVRDSRGALVALEPKNASNTTPPNVEWETSGARWTPAIVDVDGDGTYEIAGGDTGTATLRDSATGAPLWSAAVTSDATAHVTGVDLDGDGANEIGIMSYDPSSGAQIITLLDSGGAPLWPDVRFASSGRGSFSAGDLDGDAVDDLVVEFGSYLYTIDGATGAVLDDQYSGFLSMAPLLADVEGDGDPEIVSSGFGDTYMTWDIDASGVTSHRAQLANSPATEVTYYQYGALVACPTGPRYIYAPQNTGHVRIVDPRNATLVLDAYLAGGVSYASEGAVPVGIAPAFVGNVNAVAQLGGDGLARALAGSTDGYLYALRPCATSATSLVDWAMAFGASVGEPIPADVDGDGQAEVIVSANDGYLYAIDHATVASPRAIGEVSSPGELAAHELDDIRAGDPIVIEWDPIDGVVGYEIAIFDGLGAPVLDPPFRAVGSSTSASFDELPIVYGNPYYAAVRAVTVSGARSFEHVSDGFRVVRSAEPAVHGEMEDEASTSGDEALATPDSGGCSTSRTSGPGWLALVVVLVALGRRRRNT
jgi:MYXO-CTERM domain-containing protein